MATVDLNDPDVVSAAYKGCFDTEDGSLVLRHLAAKFGAVSRSTFTTGATRGLDLAFAEGQRSVLVAIGNAIEAPARPPRADRGEGL